MMLERKLAACRYRFISLNSTPPLDLEVASVSMIDTTTASAGALKFFTTASVMSFTSAFFCSWRAALDGVNVDFRHLGLPCAQS